MNDDLNNVLDSCLAELLGAKHPPDLSARILGQLDSRQLEPRPSEPHHSGADALLPPACEPSPAICVESPATRGSAVGPSPALEARIRHTRARQTRARQDRPVLVVALTTLALGLLVLITTFGVLWRRDRARIDVVERPTTGLWDVVETPETPSPATAPLSSVPPATAGSPASSSPANSRPSPVGPAPVGPAPVAPSGGSPSVGPGNGMKPAPTVVAAPSVTGESGVPSSVAGPDSPRPESPRPESQLAADPLPESWPEDQIVAFVNRSVREEWTRFSATPPQPIGADAWRERVFLTLLGRTPRADESTVPVANAAARAELVQRLMQADEYVEEFTRRWSQLLAESYLPAEVATAANSFSREGMLHYFRRALVEGRSWERVTKELLTAVGSGIPGAADYDGASNFLLSRAGGKFELATADTARLFHGRDVSCVPCHYDLERGSRQQREF